jgi:hypothetical protein
VALLATNGGSTASPSFVLVYRIAAPRATASRALALARSLGLEGPAVRASPTSFIVSNHSGERSLVLYKASGGFDYVDRTAYRRAPTGELPTADQASRFAVDFLRRRNLLPVEDVRIAVRPDSRSSPTAQVLSITPLAMGAPVLDGAITFWLGGGGTIERLRDEERPLAAAAVRVTARPRADVLKEIRDDLGSTSGLRMRLAYVAQPSYLPQPYLDPVYEAVSHGLVLDRVRATTFTPRAIITSPNPDIPIVAGRTVHLRARGTEGRRPYRFRWYANASGFLGTGKALDLPLRAEDTELRLTIRDSSGAGTTYAVPVWVAGARRETPRTFAVVQQTGSYADGTISFEADQDAYHPLAFRDIEAGGLRRAAAVYFDQLRYSVLVRFLGTDYHITSQRCRPLTAPGDACTLPRSPYAQSAGASAPAVSDGHARVGSALTLVNLPGDLQVLVEGSAGLGYCGPAGELGAIGLELLAKFVFGTGTTRLGGDCPGFQPSVEWSYRPPARFTPSDFARLCLQAAGLCDVPQAQLAQWVTGALDAGPQPEIADFRLSVYTAIDPGSEPGRAALVSDGSSPLTPAASDGPLDPQCAAPFPCISPIATERSAALASPEGRGDWDELYLKSETPEPDGIAFPHCNNRTVRAYDLPDCIHLRERSRGQQVTAFIVRRRSGEASPDSVERLADGESLRQDAQHGYDLVVWHRSTASSTQCYPAGGVDNTDRPCRVFPQALFFTPR